MKRESAIGEKRRRRQRVRDFQDFMIFRGAYDIYAHAHTVHGLPSSPQFLLFGPAESSPSICPGQTQLNALFTICLLASNFHLSDWLVWLEHRPEAEVHGE